MLSFCFQFLQYIFRVNDHVDEFDQKGSFTKLPNVSHVFKLKAYKRKKNLKKLKTAWMKLLIDKYSPHCYQPLLFGKMYNRELLLALEAR